MDSPIKSGCVLSWMIRIRWGYHLIPILWLCRIPNRIAFMIRPQFVQPISFTSYYDNVLRDTVKTYVPMSPRSYGLSCRRVKSSILRAILDDLNTHCSTSHRSCPPIQFLHLFKKRDAHILTQKHIHLIVIAQLTTKQTKPFALF